MSGKRPNPFVGPRPLAYGEHLYGRERELAELRDILISERVVLLYSPSGAGKTSLIEAGLRPALEHAEFTVLPTARVGRPPPRGQAKANRYVLSILADLEETASSPMSLEQLAMLTLARYLDQRIDDYRVLILDQFEEIFTVDPIDRSAKAECFAQLGAALEQHRHRLWLMVAMREEYIAGLDAFSRAIPGYLNTRFRLELLQEQDARRAIAKSAADGGVPFTEQAVALLVDDLRTVLVQEPGGTLTEQVGQYVEPVHLQVVCRRLWEHLPPQAIEITPADVQLGGHVDDALGAYYDECVARAARESHISERSIRNWLDEKLITPEGMRGQVLKSVESSDGMDNRVLDRLVDHHLVRAELRRALTWYELAHDRLVEPVRDSNRRWHELHLQPWQRTAEQWARAARPASNLLSGNALAYARSWSKEHPDTTAAIDREYLQRSAREQAARDSEVRRRRAFRGLAAILAAGVLGAGGYFYWTWIQLRPWGVLVNLSEGNMHALTGAYILAGRGAAQFTPAISLQSDEIGRTHLLIDRDRHVIDLRSRTGTSRNGRFLGEGDQDLEDLSDSDVLVLGNVVPFRFHSINYPWWRPWAVDEPQPPAIPGAAWGLLIDGDAKNVHYLVRGEYYVGLTEKGQIALSEARTDQSRVFLRRQPRSPTQSNPFSIEVLDDRRELLAVFKHGDYTYSACGIPSARTFSKISFGSLDKKGLCQGITLRPDRREETRDQVQPVENLIFYISTSGSLRLTGSFRVIPRVAGLERSQ